MLTCQLTSCFFWKIFGDCTGAVAFTVTPRSGVTGLCLGLGTAGLPAHLAAHGFCFMVEKGVGTRLGVLPMCPKGGCISIPSSEHEAAGASLGGAGPPRVQASTLDCICLLEPIKPSAAFLHLI